MAMTNMNEAQIQVEMEYFKAGETNLVNVQKAFAIIYLLFGIVSSLCAQTVVTRPSQLEPQPPNTVPLAPRSLHSHTAHTESIERSDSPYFKGKAKFITLRPPMKGLDGVQTSATDLSKRRSTKNTDVNHGDKNARMPFWQGSFEYLGATFPFRMIGTDPSKGSARTEIPVMVIPIEFAFANGTRLSASESACGDTRSPSQRILKSPLFDNFPFNVGNTFLGNTQYIDAFQRANFWTAVSSTSPGYHVLLSASLASPVSFSVPEFPIGSTVNGPCGPVGFDDIGDIDAQVRGEIDSLGIPAGTLPVFIMYNTFGTSDGECCILGYHSVTFDANRHPYVVASYSDPGLFITPIQDIHALSHELGEWMDDPFVRSFVPSWGQIGQVPDCNFALETGDPVTGTAFEVKMNGFNYHPEDLVFLSWFARETPSKAASGQYTFLNSVPQVPGICGQ
jgi:hypothetical protein